ncbi:MAG: hypothetical protein J6P60_05170 [Lachnospiraceae bacterium]|nr:hypothetical protein [Lachnospiraceae bacterium]
MKKNAIFFCKLLLMGALVAGFCFLCVMPQYTYNNQAAMVDKVRHLQSLEGSKITLVGNSNLAFGIQSQLLEQELGMPVANMGLHGGVGNAFNEQAAKINIDEGDLIILSPSSFHDNDRIKNPELAWITIENHPEMFRFIRLKDIPDMAMAYPTYLRKCIGMWANGTGNQDTEPIYSRSKYNAYGDNIYPRPQSLEELDLSEVGLPQISDAYVERVNALNRYVTERGATLLVAAYPIAWTEDAPSKEEYAAFERSLRSRLDCEVISDYTDYCLEPKYFYNTYLHLTDEGARIRTELLIGDIRRYLEKR